MKYKLRMSSQGCGNLQSTMWSNRANCQAKEQSKDIGLITFLLLAVSVPFFSRAIPLSLVSCTGVKISRRLEYFSSTACGAWHETIQYLLKSFRYWMQFITCTKHPLFILGLQSESKKYSVNWLSMIFFTLQLRRAQCFLRWCLVGGTKVGLNFSP